MISEIQTYQIIIDLPSSFGGREVDSVIAEPVNLIFRIIFAGSLPGVEEKGRRLIRPIYQPAIRW